MKWVADIAICIVVLASTIQAAASGFFQEAFAIAGLVVGYLLAAWQYARVAVWFENYLKSSEVAEVAGFLTILVAVVLLAGLLGRFARWIVKESGLSFLDRLLGAVLGFLRGCLVVAFHLVQPSENTGSVSVEEQIIADAPKLHTRVASTRMEAQE